MEVDVFIVAKAGLAGRLKPGPYKYLDEARPNTTDFPQKNPRAIKWEFHHILSDSQIVIKEFFDEQTPDL
jgi:hypothetical protein